MQSRSDVYAAGALLTLAFLAIVFCPAGDNVATSSLSTTSYLSGLGSAEGGKTNPAASQADNLANYPASGFAAENSPNNISAPHADFEIFGFEGPAPHTVKFSCSSEGSVTEHIWDFGDGTYLSTDVNPVHVYQLPGRYTVRLTVSGPGGTTTTEREECVVVSANTIHVNGGFESACRGSDENDGLTWDSAVATLQRALDLASARAGQWTVLVADGVYTGPGNNNLHFKGSSIRLQSVGGAQQCVIDCAESGQRAFSFTKGGGDEICVEGLTVRGGSAEFGGAVLCSATEPTFKNCIFQECSADVSGGAVACTEGASPRFVSCDFLNCVATSGGAIAVSQASPFFEHCTISDNSAGNSGGGVYCAPLSVVTLRGCYLTGNVAVMGKGGGVYSAGGEVKHEHSELAENIANGAPADFEEQGESLPELQKSRDELFQYVDGRQPSSYEEAAGVDFGAG